MATQQKHKVLILGAGFGGIKTALELSRSPNLEITILSDRDSFRYYPTLYTAAVGKSSTGSTIPLSEIFEDKNVRINKTQAKTVNREKQTVKDTAGKIYKYDILVIALGVVTNFFGIKGLEEYSYGIKSLEEAQELRNHLHKQLIDDKKPDLNYVVIGGGPTGVELAGALPAYIHHIMKKHGLRERKVHIDLVEAAPRLLPRLPKPTSHAVQKNLRKLGVKLYLNEAVKAETADSLMLNDHPLESHTVVWTAGVTNHPFLKENDFELNEHGKAAVNEYLRAESNIYVIGDNADTPYSGMAQTALYDGIFVAENIKRSLEGKKLHTYVPSKPIYVITAGPRWAAVLWGNLHLYGWAGWVLRETADLKGFSDYEPWWKASKHFLAINDTEESCALCTES
jgi:NADH dehydrogenase